MGRSNTCIIGFGLFACIALSLAMKHAVTVKKRHGDSAIVEQIRLIFGQRLEGDPKLAFEMVNGKKLAVLTLQPKRHVGGRSLAQMIGMFVWRMKDNETQFDGLDVVLKKDVDDAGQRITVVAVSTARRSHERRSQTTNGKTKPPVTRPVVPKK